MRNMWTFRRMPFPLSNSKSWISRFLLLVVLTFIVSWFYSHSLLTRRPICQSRSRLSLKVSCLFSLFSNCSSSLLLCWV
ncbi:unnamed protein product, partial [Sphagnum balticum]